MVSYMMGKWLGTLGILLVMNPGLIESAQASEQSARKAYRLTVTIHGSFGACRNEEVVQELYVVISRLDPEIQEQIDSLEREGKQITGGQTWSHGRRLADDLRKRDFTSESEPLAEAEQESFEKLRGVRPRERTYEEEQEFEALQARVPISVADAAVVARMTELESQRRRLIRERAMTSSAGEPNSLRVYEDEELGVVLMEEDWASDDTCFGTTVVLDRSVLAKRTVDVKKDDTRLLTLNLTPLD